MIEGPGDSPQYVLARLEPARLRAARERAALTGVRLADKVGVTPSAISQFESGAAKPDLDTLVRLSMALAVPTTFFAHRGRVGGSRSETAARASATARSCSTSSRR